MGELVGRGHRRENWQENWQENWRENWRRDWWESWEDNCRENWREDWRLFEVLEVAGCGCDICQGPFQYIYSEKET